ncbi:hypothetical protein [Fusobacterium varium]
MKLKFKLLKLKKDSKSEQWFKKAFLKAEKSGNCSNNKLVNEFIMVGKETVEGINHIKVLKLTKYGLNTFGGLPLDIIAYSLPEYDFEWDGVTYAELNLDKKSLSLDLVDTIKELNYF